MKPDITRRRMRVIAFVAALGLTGCSTALEAPRLDPEQEWNLAAVSSTLERIDVDEEQVCPVIEPETLIVFSEKATSSDNGATLEVSGVTLEPGSRFETSDLNELDGGYDCGGRHYDKAVHVVFPGVTLLDTP